MKSAMVASLKGERPEVDPERGLPQMNVAIGPARVGPEERGRGSDERGDATRGLDTQESLKRAPLRAEEAAPKLPGEEDVVLAV